MPFGVLEIVLLSDLQFYFLQLIFRHVVCFIRRLILCLIYENLYIAGKKVLQLETNKERYELKSSDVGQMLEIFTQLENNFDIPKSTDL